MFERIVSLEINNAYNELMKLLLTSNFRIVAEEQSRSIRAEHGSLWGMTPKNVKKIVTFSFSGQDSKTKIAGNVSLTKDWILSTLIGFILLIILIPPALWLSTNFGALGRSDFATFYLGLAIFLVAILPLAGILDTYIYAKRESYPKEILKLLQQE